MSEELELDIQKEFIQKAQLGRFLKRAGLCWFFSEMFSLGFSWDLDGIAALNANFDVLK